jgi:Ca2+-binding RTX toxin-like protein
LAALFALPSLAQAATLYAEGRTPHHLLLQADPGETNLVTVEGSSRVVIRDDGGGPITLAGVPTCMPLDLFAVSCSAVRRIELDLGDGPDVAVIDTPHEVDIDAGNGPDRYVAHAAGSASRVDFDGGIGLDVANYRFATAGVKVAVDREAGDGRAGDDDRIRRTVESVFGSSFDDTLIGDDRDQTLAGNDGDDRITGGAGADVLTGDDGNDRLEARDGELDTVDCGGHLLDWAGVDLTEASVMRCAELAF